MSDTEKWDLCYLPQKDGTKSLKGMAQLPSPLDVISGKEFGKQKFVYDGATAGAVWLHQVDLSQTTGAGASNSQLFKQAPKFLDLAAAQAIVRDSNSLQFNPVRPSAIFQSVLGIEAKDRDVPNVWKAQIDKFRDLLKNVRTVRYPMPSYSFSFG